LSIGKKPVNYPLNIVVMKNGLLILAFIFLLVCQGQSQDIEVNFNGENALIDSVIATNLTTGESIKIPGNAILTLRQNPTGIKIIPLDKGNLSVVYPTFGKTIVIHYSSWFSQEIIIRLTDISGRILAQKRFTTTRGINQFKISTKHFGLYFISLQTGENCYNAKFVSKGLGSNDILFFGVEELKDNDEPLKSGRAESFVLLFSSGDIISYEFYSGKRLTVINEEAGASNVLSPEFYECVDYESKSYSVVKIGDQWWMAENLRSTRFANGAELLLLEDNDLWSHLLPTEKACCFYNNNESLDYGALYTYAAAVNGIPYDGTSPVQGVCPSGWHLPDNNEWLEMKNYLIDNGYNWDRTTTDNKIGKSLASTSGWTGSGFLESMIGYNQVTNNRTGFNAQPVGFRDAESGLFLNEGILCNWWSSTEHSDSIANKWNLEVWNSGLYHHINLKTSGYSVRCVKDRYSSLVANFKADKTEVYLGDVVTFTDLSSGEPENWKWNFGDCSSSTEHEPTHIYSSPGSYKISLEIENRLEDYSVEIKTNYITVLNKAGKRIVADTEGNEYKTIKIGTQLWMAENLVSTRYADSMEIPHITDNTEWGNLAADNLAKAYSFYNNDESLDYGALYTFAAAVNGTPYNGTGYVQGICPNGWHVPAESEWNILENYLIENGYNYDGSTIGNKIGKSLASVSGWTISTSEGAVGNSQSKNNSSGFNGLPGGYRSYYSKTGEFSGAGEGGYWWMANDVFEETAMFWNLYFDYKHVLRDYTFKRTGLCVRCLKNDDGSPLADFTSDVTEVKLGGLVNFTDLSTNSPNKWIWNFDECETSEEQNPAYRFNRAGVHRVTLISFNDTDYDVETKEGYINVTQRTSVVNDIEGNIYHTVEIGDQWWMAENLKTTKFNNGTDIPLVTDNEDWLSTTTPAYGWFDNDQVTYGNTYGALYNWYTINTGDLCPAGWHVPTNSEWNELELTLGMSREELNTTGFRGTNQGSKLAGNADLWKVSEDNNSSIIESDVHFGISGFNALPGGTIFPCSTGICSRPTGTIGYWWSSDEFDSNNAWYRGLLNFIKGTVKDDIDKKSGLSVRCVKD
jgi:uncharacterized protein (TIGR02145 family)